MSIDKLNAELAAFIDGLYEGEKKVLVFGEGEADAPVMLVGEAPGEQESLMGRPFVGKAGKNLNEFLEGAGMERRALYVTNTVKFRPTKTSAAGRTVNRPPTQEEVKLFVPWLEKEIALVNPKCVVTLGNVPLKALTDRRQVIGSLHGQFMDLGGRLLFPMYHPASVIYNPSLKEVYRRDLCVFAQWYKKIR